MLGINFASIKKTVADLGAQVGQLKADIQTAKQQRELIEAAPLAREDVVGLVDALILRAKAEFPGKLAESLSKRIIQCKTDLAADKTALGLDRSSNLLALHIEHAGSQPADVFDLEFSLLGVLSDQLRGPLIEAVRTMPWPGEPGLPLVQRKVELAKLDKQIAELEGQLQALVREAESAGLALG